MTIKNIIKNKLLKTITDKILLFISSTFILIKGEIIFIWKIISYKNYGEKDGFSMKRFIAFALSINSLHNFIMMSIYPMSHWTVSLTQAGVSDAVIITLIGVREALTFAALSVYGITKAKGAA